MSFLDDLLRQIRGGGQPQGRPAPAQPRIQQAPPAEIKYPRSNPDTGFYDAGPAPEIKYPRANPDTGFYQSGPDTPAVGMRRPISNPGPAPFRAAGLPQTFYRAPQLPTHDPELYDELLNFGGFNDFRGF